MSEAKAITDHKEIRKSIEARKGHPTAVHGTEGKDGQGILRVDLREPDDKLEPIACDDFFKTFDDRKLAFLPEDRTKDGAVRRFNKFVHPE